MDEFARVVRGPGTGRIAAFGENSWSPIKIDVERIRNPLSLRVGRRGFSRFEGAGSGASGVSRLGAARRGFTVVILRIRMAFRCQFETGTVGENEFWLVSD